MKPKYVAASIIILLLAWQLLSSVRAHPDYLAYFNEFAGSHPERILLDSDLDWGQDLLRLSTALQQKHIDQVSIAYAGSSKLDLSKFGLPPFRVLLPNQPATGWIAISLLRLKVGEPGLPDDGFSWLEAYQPVALVGQSIRLYYVPQPDQSKASCELAQFGAARSLRQSVDASVLREWAISSHSPSPPLRRYCSPPRSARIASRICARATRWPCRWMIVQRRYPQGDFGAVIAQPFDQVQHRRVLTCQHIFDLLMSGSERVVVVNLMQLRNQRHQKFHMVTPGRVGQVHQGRFASLETGTGYRCIRTSNTPSNRGGYQVV